MATKKVSEYTDDELTSVKADLEQRLARFQKAFFEQHNRNPNEDERKPARPAINKYRDVCQELAERKRRGAETKEAEANAAAGSATPRQIQVITEAKMAHQPGAVVAAVREATRRQARDAADTEAGAPIKPMREATRRQAAAQAAVKFTGFLGGSSMLDLIFTWGQFISIWGDLTTFVSQSAFDEGLALEDVAPWAVTLEEYVFKYMRFFEFDVQAFNANFDIAFLQQLGWREQHLGFTVLVPFAISLFTIFLLRSVNDIARLALLTCGLLLLVFASAAYIILAVATSLRGAAETVVGIDSSSINVTIAIGAGISVFAAALMVLKQFSTHTALRQLLVAENDELSAKLYGVKENLANAEKDGIQESLPNAKELREILESDHEVQLVGGRATSAEEFLKQMKQAAKDKQDPDTPEVPKLSSFIKALVTWLIVSVGALILWLRVNDALPDEMMDAFSESYEDLYYGGAIVLTILSGTILIYEFLTLNTAGQKFVHWLEELFKASFVGFLIVTITILYIPISKQALSVFVCSDHPCAQGSWFPIQSTGADSNLASYLTSFTSSYTSLADATGDANSTAHSVLGSLAPAQTCQSCNWLGGPASGNTCPSSLSDSLCPASTTFRLDANPSIDCEQQWAFYMPGAILTIFMFTVGVPYMFYQLTTRHTKMYSSLDVYSASGKAVSSSTRNLNSYMDRFRYGRSSEASKYTPEELDDLWLRRVRRAKRNRAKNLYGDFEFQWRYWKMIILIQKFLAVFIMTLKFKFGSPLVAPVLMLLLHCTMLLLNVSAQPYTDRRPDLFSMAISFSNVFNWALLLVLAVKVSCPQWMIYLIIVINIGIPVCSLITGHFLNQRKARLFEERMLAINKKNSYLPPDKVAKKRRVVERDINKFTLRLLSRWTWGVIIMSVMAGELIFIGTFAEAALSPITGPTAGQPSKANVVECYKEEYARGQEFIGFGNWSRFTQSCCCMARGNSTSTVDFSLHIYELWMCRNDIGDSNSQDENPIIYKERQRRPIDAGSTVSGLPYRDFCGTVFKDTAGNPVDDEPVWNDDLGMIGFYQPDMSTGTSEFISNYW